MTTRKKNIATSAIVAGVIGLGLVAGAAGIANAQSLNTSAHVLSGGAVSDAVSPAPSPSGLRPTGAATPPALPDGTAPTDPATADGTVPLLPDGTLPPRTADPSGDPDGNGECDAEDAPSTGDAVDPTDSNAPERVQPAEPRRLGQPTPDQAPADVPQRHGERTTPGTTQG